MKKFKILVFLALVYPVVAAADGCLSPGEKPGTKTVVVKPPGRPTEPGFYYRTDLYFTVFVSQAAMTKFLDKLDPSSQDVPLVKAIRADMPLHEDHDLFRYSFSDWYVVTPIESTLVHLLREGDASLLDVGGRALKKITIVDKRTRAITFTTVYAGEKGENNVLTVRDCVLD